MVELPNRPEGNEDGNPRTALKKDRKARVNANEGRRARNTGEEATKKKSVMEELVTRKLAQRLQKTRIGKTLGGRAGRRR